MRRSELLRCRTSIYVHFYPPVIAREGYYIHPPRPGVRRDSDSCKLLILGA
jgi:hypothetical protein